MGKGRVRRWKRRNILQNTHLILQSQPREGRKRVVARERCIGSGWVPEGTKGVGREGERARNLKCACELGVQEILYFTFNQRY